MKVIAARTVTDEMLTTSLIETDSVTWQPGVSYPKGARARDVKQFDFTSGALPLGATLTRASSATYTFFVPNGNGATAMIVAEQNVPRFEIRNNTCVGLIVEPQRTNFQIGSGSVDGSNFRIFGTRSSGATGPNGAASSRLTRSPGYPNGLLFDQYPSDYGAGDQAVRTFSAFVRQAGATVLQFNFTGGAAANFDLAAGAVASTQLATATIERAVNGFQRAAFSHTKTNAYGYWSALADPTSTTATTSIDFACVQLEDGPTPTSYIPTTNAPATRAADVLTLDWGQKAGVADGSYTARYYFDDGTTQDLPATISGGKMVVPAASLARYIIARIRLVEVLDSTRVFESLKPDNQGHPLTDPSWWLDIAPTNRWAMFDGAIGSLSHATGSFSATIKLSAAIDSVAVLDVTAASVRVRITANGTQLYDQTSLTGGVAGTSLTFFGLSAPANSIVTVTVEGGSQFARVTAGTLLVGTMVNLGLTEAGPSIGITDFSKRETDDFGVTTVVERGWARRMTIRSKVDTSAVDGIQASLAAIRAVPSLWIGEDGYDSLTIYGFFKEFSVDLALETISFCSLTVEGMTSAS